MMTDELPTYRPGSARPNVTVCDLCGAVVDNHEAHNRWHALMAEMLSEHESD